MYNNIVGKQMTKKSFDQYAEKYDEWFLSNQNVLYSEVKLVAKALTINTVRGNHFPGDTLSIGCGSALFEMILEKEWGIKIVHGIEPSVEMASIARKRGMEVVIGTAENTDFGEACYDTVMFNGTPSYIDNLQYSFKKAYDALRPGGQIVVIDVPKESSYALMYNLAKALDTWDNILLKGVTPPMPYPIEFVRQAHWRTTAEKVEMLNNCGFSNLTFNQTLTRHPIYTGDSVEEPVEGFDKGDYVSITAWK